MAGQLARVVARFIARCPYAQSVHDLATKQRVTLEGGYTIELYFLPPPSVQSSNHFLLRESTTDARNGTLTAAPPL